MITTNQVKIPDSFQALTLKIKIGNEHKVTNTR